ncbi:hypothetical protein IRJ41_004909 [Triplophysa rosa]|uniref:Uncharacterized protein n=1 Tax=Triplophysa rosa TaxID=992332 RepID=A0A9W8C6D6_TRIRA|nr:hypothetical protein IRJ41_004909 [Triplophysa rosa]
MQFLEALLDSFQIPLERVIGGRNGHVEVRTRSCCVRGRSVMWNRQRVRKHGKGRSSLKLNWDTRVEQTMKHSLPPLQALSIQNDKQWNSELHQLEDNHSNSSLVL